MGSSIDKDGVELVEQRQADVHEIRHADDFEPHRLTWRSWVVVFVTNFAILAQIFTVTAAGGSIGFIIRDLGSPSIAGWIVQGPLLVQAVLSPVIGRLSDVLDRKYLASIPPLVAFAGAVISAKATNMNMLIGGGILIGFTLPTIAIVQAIPSEILPLKYRPLSNGLAFIAGTLGALIAVLGGGRVVAAGPAGWRDIYWMQAAFHMASAVGIMAFYWPPKRPYELRAEQKSWRKVIWSCDPIGSLVLITGATLLIMGLNWAGGSYAWKSVHVLSTLVTGAVLLVVFGIYEWIGRNDGLIAHVFFKDGPNLGLSIFAFTIEGWIFFSAVNNVSPLIILNLGWETSAWKIGLRQIPVPICTLLSAPFLIMWATKKKDMKKPLIFTFSLFLVGTCCYAAINENLKTAQLGYNAIIGIGQSGPLTLLTAFIQFAAPPEELSTATGLAYSARALGGALGNAVLTTIINNKLGDSYAKSVGTAAVKAGLPPTSLGALFAGLARGDPTLIEAVPGISSSILGAAMSASHTVYAAAYRLAWSSIIPLVVVATVCCFFLTDVGHLMTEHIDATVEKIPEGKNIDFE